MTESLPFGHTFFYKVLGNEKAAGFAAVNTQIKFELSSAVTFRLIHTRTSILDS